MSNIVDFKKPPKKPKNKPGNNNGPKEPPLINLPPLTKYMIMAMIVVHIILEFFLGDYDRAYMILNFGYTPAIWTGQSVYPFDFNALISPLTYMLLHGNWTHLIMNCVMLMAFGTGVEKWMGQRKFLEFFILCGIAAVIVQTILFPFSDSPVIGASGAESGLFAAILILLQSQGRLPTGRYGIWPFAALWIGISLLFGFAGGNLAGGSIAWAAHLGGFLAGLALLELKYFHSA